jgi:hypothetical protein
MSLKIINDLFQEVRRLSIAGVRFSRNDFRLRNVLEEMAGIKDSSAVMQRLYSAGMKVLESDDNEINDNFFELSNLVTAVMVTRLKLKSTGNSKILKTSLWLNRLTYPIAGYTQSWKL